MVLLTLRKSCYYRVGSSDRENAVRHDRRVLNDLPCVRAVSVASSLLCCLILLAGCDRDSGAYYKALAGIRDGSAKRLLQQHFDARPECAEILSTDLKGFGMQADPGSAAARALLAAGLIVAAPQITPSTSGHRSFLPGPNAQRWMIRTSAKETTVPTYRLCFAKREITNVWLQADSPLPFYRYGFRLKDRAPWLGNLAIRRAFPAIQAAASGIEFVGNESLPVHDGKPDLSPVSSTDRQPAPFFAFQVRFNEQADMWATAAERSREELK